ncbi:MAG: hypothetical protein WD847_13300 [Pirellulales bacterium]
MSNRVATVLLVSAHALAVLGLWTATKWLSLPYPLAVFHQSLSASQLGLASIWLGLSRVRRSRRLCVVLCFVTIHVFLMIAPNLAALAWLEKITIVAVMTAIHLVYMGLVALPLAALRFRGSRLARLPSEERITSREGLQFRLVHVFLWTLIVAVLFALGQVMPAFGKMEGMAIAPRRRFDPGSLAAVLLSNK